MKEKFSAAKINDSIINTFKVIISNAYDNREDISFETSIKSSLISFQNNPIYNSLSTRQANTILNTMSDLIRKYRTGGIK
jgi:hypothetical protein